MMLRPAGAAAAQTNDDYAKLQQLQAAANSRADLQTRSGTVRRAGNQPGQHDTDVSTLKIGARASGRAAGADRRENRQGAFRRRLGIRQVDIGQYLTAGTAVVTLQRSTDPGRPSMYRNRPSRS